MDLREFSLPVQMIDHSNLKQTCGETLYGDYIERTPGSLQRFARELGGQVLSGPAKDTATPASSSAPSVPVQAHIREESSSIRLTGSNSSQSISDSLSRTVVEPGAIEGNLTAASSQNEAPTKWLELCIRSRKDPYLLGEIDVAGKQTDRTVFRKIREKYRRSKVSARLFGRFDLRVPNGATFVQVRVPVMSRSIRFLDQRLL